MGFAQEYRRQLLSVPTVGCWVVATGIATLSGPFGTYEGVPLPQRGAYWSTVIGLSLVISLGVRPALVRIAPRLTGWTLHLSVAGVFTTLFTPILYQMTVFLLIDPEVDTRPSFLAMAAVVLAISIGINVFREALIVHASVDDRAQPRLLRRLENGGQTILRISGRDHYVDVYTEAGVSTLLMRFSDALDELDEARGLRVHRSHWVAADAVKTIERDGHRMFLRLLCGAQVPVSRSYRGEVERSKLFASPKTASVA